MKWNYLLLSLLCMGYSLLNAEPLFNDRSIELSDKVGLQLSGYAALDYQTQQNEKSPFVGAVFAPILHAKYANIFQFEGELEITKDNRVGTNTIVEYAAGTFFINDYLGLQVGKFLSPVGQFVQNQHPSWINKLPDAPLGFGHDGAAPSSVLGLALRGGLAPIQNIRSNYTLFIANAPVYEKAPDGDIIINAEGRFTPSHGRGIIGGRYGINLFNSMEIGASLASGKITETINNGKLVFRDYKVVDFDLMYNINSFDIKAEYVKQTIGTNNQSTLDLNGGIWRAYYGQIAYQVDHLHIEPVIRYGEYRNPEINYSQLSLGCNYLFTSSIMAKLAYEFNHDKLNASPQSIGNSNTFLMQLAIGF